MASMLVFSAVIADAAMVERVIGMDVLNASSERENAPRRNRAGAARVGPREVEGMGGRFWYELVGQ